MSENRKNAYYCDDCEGYVVTIDVDEGVTPMFLACRVKGDPGAADNDCSGRMRSMMYPDEPWPDMDGYGQRIPIEPTWEWYRPDDAELNMLGVAAPEILDHVRKGGLLLRPRETSVSL